MSGPADFSEAMYAKERRVCPLFPLLKVFTDIKCKKNIPKNCKALSPKPMLAASSFTDHKMHHSNINHMHEVLTAIKMSEVLASVLKMWGLALKQSIILNHKICKLQSGIFQVLFKLIKQRNSKTRLEFFPELTQRQPTANCY